MTALDAVGAAALRRAQEALRLVEPPSGDLLHYSLPRALQYALMEGQAEFCPEAMVSEEYERLGFKRQLKRSIFVPPAILLRNLDRTGLRVLQPYQTTVTGSGAELVETTFRGDLFIDALRPRSITLQLGAQSVGELVGDVQVPRLDTTSTAYWLSPSGSPVQSAPITESEGAFDTPTPIKSAPAVVGAYSTASRLLMQQTKSRLAEIIISNDLMRTLGTSLDSAVIQGSGSAGLPLGVVNQVGVNAISGTAFSLATSITAVQDLATANAIISRRALGWAATPAVAGLLMARFKVAANSYSPIWEGSLDTGEINAHPALSSTNVPAATAIFGDWSQVLILTWGPAAPVEVEVNPYQNFATGDVGIRALLSANIVCRHPASFSVVSSIT